MGWGAYYGLATRRPGLSRWQRGDMKTLIEIPAIIADIDEALDSAMPRIRDFPVSPSCVIRSGHGVHLIWLLSEPTCDFHAVNAIHHGIAKALKGDYLTAATALRLPGSLNTKNGGTAPCEVFESDWSHRYDLTDFAIYPKLPELHKNRKEEARSRSGSRVACPDPHTIQKLADILIRQGFKWRSTWLNGPCPNAYQHKHADHHPSFGFNTATGYGYCFVCGTMQPEVVSRTFSVAVD